MGTVSDIIHTKTIYNFWPGTDKHFTGNALSSSDNSHATHSHFELCHDKQCLLHPEEKFRGIWSGEHWGHVNGTVNTLLYQNKQHSLEAILHVTSKTIRIGISATQQTVCNAFTLCGYWSYNQPTCIFITKFY